MTPNLWVNWRTVYFPHPLSWVIEYESLQRPYISGIMHYMTHNKGVTSRTVYFPLPPSWVIDYESLQGPYIFRLLIHVTHNLWVNLEDRIFFVYGLWVTTRTVYFPLWDRKFSTKGPNIFKVWGPYTFANRIFFAKRPFIFSFGTVYFTVYPNRVRVST